MDEENELLMHRPPEVLMHCSKLVAMATVRVYMSYVGIGQK